MMAVVNLQLECARRAIMRAKTGSPGGTIGVQTAIEIVEGIVGVTSVGVGEESIARKIGRRRGTMTGRDMRIRSRRSPERM
jgi:hypothetical protein